MAKVSENETIIVNGEKMTIKAWKQMVAEKQKERRGKKRFLKVEKPKKAVKEKKEIGAMAEEIEKLVKPMTTLKSVQVYRNHAYRSWGSIANEIFSHSGIRKPMASYCVNFNELNTLISDVQSMAKKNEKAAFQFVEKIAWKLEDMKTNIKEMMDGVSKSGVCERFKNHEAIYGKGRQLGLQTIIVKCLKTIGDIEDVVKALNKMVDDGVDPFSYGNHMSLKARHRCWA